MSQSSDPPPSVVEGKVEVVELEVVELEDVEKLVVGVGGRLVEVSVGQQSSWEKHFTSVIHADSAAQNSAPGGVQAWTI